MQTKFFDEYVRNGGMACSYLYNTEKEKHSYVEDVYNTLIARGIKKKYKIKNNEILEGLIISL